MITYCDINTCGECPRYGDDCDGDKRVEHTDLISRADAIEAVASITMSIHLSDVICDKLLALPSADAVSEDELHDGCYGCRYEHNTEYEYPCKDCKQNYMDKWESKTNDIVEVVRCKDCKYGEETYLQSCVYCVFSKISSSKDGYCHHGERREL